MRISKFFYIFLLVFCFVISLNAQSIDNQNTQPPYLPVSEIGSFGTSNSPSQTVLSQKEEDEFKAYVKNLPTFPRYLYSGCHDRAHAAYVLLPNSLKDKVSKVWVVSPSKYSAAIKGSIRLKPEIPDSADVSWDYHIALAYKTSNGFQIFDSAMAQDKVLPIQSWFAAMSFSPLSFYTVTAGRVYVFYTTATDQFSLNKDIWSGNASDYSGKFATEHWIPSALARDAVGEAIFKNSACNEIKSEIKQPAVLLTRLQTKNVPTNCQNLIELYDKQRQTWIQRLSSSGQ